MEVEEMISKVREKQGRSFDVRKLATSCVVNVVLSMLFGHRFEHSDPAFQQLISDFHDGSDIYSLTLEIFPALRFIPYFSKLIVKQLELIKSIHSFISNNIDACSQVCNCISRCKNLACYPQWIKNYQIFIIVKEVR